VAVLIAFSVMAMGNSLLYTRRKIRKVINMIAAIGASLIGSLAITADGVISSPPPIQGSRGIRTRVTGGPHATDSHGQQRT
jgi:hypothetical protein